MKISPSTLTGLINEGKIGVLSIGKREKIPMVELIRYIKENIVRTKTREDYYFNERSPHDILIEPRKSRGTMNGDQILNDLLEKES